MHPPPRNRRHSTRHSKDITVEAPNSPDLLAAEDNGDRRSNVGVGVMMKKQLMRSLVMRLLVVQRLGLATVVG